MSADPPWSMGSRLDVAEQPEIIDEVLDREDRYAGIALLAPVLNHEDPGVADQRCLSPVTAFQQPLGTVRA